MDTLRSKVIRLAYTKPELRPHLLPLLTSDQARVASILSEAKRASDLLHDLVVQLVSMDAQMVRVAFILNNLYKKSPDPELLGLIRSFGESRKNMNKDAMRWAGDFDGLGSRILEYFETHQIRSPISVPSWSVQSG